MSASNVITLAIALWGAGLSTFVAIRQVRRDRPDLKLMIGPTGHPSGRLESAWKVTVANPKSRPVEVRTVALIDHQGLQASMEDPVPPIEVRHRGQIVSLPFMLNDGETLEAVLPEPLPERRPRGAWASDTFNRFYFEDLQRRRRTLARLHALAVRARYSVARWLNTEGHRERERERQATMRRAERLLRRGAVKEVPPREPFPYELEEDWHKDDRER